MNFTGRGTSMQLEFEYWVIKYPSGLYGMADTGLTHWLDDAKKYPSVEAAEEALRGNADAVIMDAKVDGPHMTKPAPQTCWPFRGGAVLIQKSASNYERRPYWLEVMLDDGTKLQLPNHNELTAETPEHLKLKAEMLATFCRTLRGLP